MRIFVTSAGMIACHTAARLIDEGADVVLYDLSPREDYISAVLPANTPTIVTGDILDLPALIDAMLDFRPDVVFHAAALIGTAAQKNLYRGYQVNVKGTVNVAEASRISGVKRVVFSSSLAVNDRGREMSGPITEDFPSSGNRNIYGASKLASEEILRAYGNAHEIEIALLRFAGVYGVGHFIGGSGVGREMFNAVAAGVSGQSASLGDGLPPMSELIYVKDVASGVAASIAAPRLGFDTYNIGTGIVHSREEVAETIRGVFPALEIEVAPTQVGQLGQRNYPFDTSRAAADLGFRARFSLDEGVRDLAEAIRHIDSGWV